MTVTFEVCSFDSCDLRLFYFWSQNCLTLHYVGIFIPLPPKYFLSTFVAGWVLHRLQGDVRNAKDLLRRNTVKGREEEDDGGGGAGHVCI